MKQEIYHMIEKELEHLVIEALELGEAWPEFWPVIEDCIGQLEPDLHRRNVLRVRLLSFVLGEDLAIPGDMWLEGTGRDRKKGR